MSYKLPPVSRCQLSDSTTQVISTGGTAEAYPILFDTNEDIKGIAHDVTGVTVTISQANPGVVGYTATAAFPALANGDCVIFTTTGALPTGLTAGTKYYVVNHSAGQFNVAAKPGGTGIETTSAGSGTHTAKCTHRIYLPTTGDWLIVYSIICNATAAGDHVDIWARLAGDNILRSNTRWENPRNGAEQVVSCSFILTTSAKDQKFELFWCSDAATSQLLATGTAASPTRPACPSAILTINKISK